MAVVVVVVVVVVVDVVVAVAVVMGVAAPVVVDVVMLELFKSKLKLFLACCFFLDPAVLLVVRVCVFKLLPSWGESNSSFVYCLRSSWASALNELMLWKVENVAILWVVGGGVGGVVGRYEKW